jgi:hypothetical protein
MPWPVPAISGLEGNDRESCRSETERGCSAPGSLQTNDEIHLERNEKTMRYIRLKDLTRKDRKELNRIVRKQRKERREMRS